MECDDDDDDDQEDDDCGTGEVGESVEEELMDRVLELHHHQSTLAFASSSSCAPCPSRGASSYLSSFSSSYHACVDVNERSRRSSSVLTLEVSLLSQVCCLNQT